MLLISKSMQTQEFGIFMPKIDIFLMNFHEIKKFIYFFLRGEIPIQYNNHSFANVCAWGGGKGVSVCGRGRIQEGTSRAFPLFLKRQGHITPLLGCVCVCGEQNVGVRFRCTSLIFAKKGPVPIYFCRNRASDCVGCQMSPHFFLKIVYAPIEIPGSARGGS